MIGREVQCDGDTLANKADNRLSDIFYNYIIFRSRSLLRPKGSPSCIILCSTVLPLFSYYLYSCLYDCQPTADVLQVTANSCNPAVRVIQCFLYEPGKSQPLFVL